MPLLEEKPLEVLCCLTIRVQTPQLSFQSCQMALPYLVNFILFCFDTHTRLSSPHPTNMSSLFHCVYVTPEAWNTASGPCYRNTCFCTMNGFLVCRLTSLCLLVSKFCFHSSGCSSFRRLF